MKNIKFLLNTFSLSLEIKVFPTNSEQTRLIFKLVDLFHDFLSTKIVQFSLVETTNCVLVFNNILSQPELPTLDRKQQNQKIIMWGYIVTNSGRWCPVLYTAYCIVQIPK